MIRLQYPVKQLIWCKLHECEKMGFIYLDNFDFDELLHLASKCKYVHEVHNICFEYIQKTMVLDDHKKLFEYSQRCL